MLKYLFKCAHVIKKKSITRWNGTELIRALDAIVAESIPRSCRRAVAAGLTRPSSDPQRKVTWFDLEPNAEALVLCQTPFILLMTTKSFIVPVCGTSR